jgi:hypothetical protein
MAWCDELPEGSGQDAPRRSSLERVRAALVDRDEALWNARADLEKTRTLAANWEAEDHVWFEDRWMVASLCDE